MALDAAQSSAAAMLREPRWWLYLLLYTTFVVYGSLVPLEWRDVPFDQALERFANIGFLNLGAGSRADWVANIVLYVPLAFLGCSALLGLRAPTIVAVLGGIFVFLLCVSLAVVVEFTQIFFEPRTVSMNDLLAEAIGSALGVLVWLFGRWQLVGMGIAFAQGGRPSVFAALVLLVIAYLLLSLFPYDFVISGAELDAQLRHGGHAWILGACEGLVRCGALWLAEVLSIAPIGLLLALLYPRWSLWRLFLIGAAAGLLLEPVQLLIVSGNAQGLSVVLRGLGVLLGGVLARVITIHLGPQPFARLVWQLVPWLVLPYVAAVTALSGWWVWPWRSLDAAVARLDSFSWIPFYYHYWTSEPVAMVSALSQLAMYMPVGVAFWARASAVPHRRTGPLLPIVTTLLFAFVVEAGKLFAPGERPGPTNVLIASTGAWMAYLALIWFSRALNQAAVGSSTAAPVSPSAPRANVSARAPTHSARAAHRDLQPVVHARGPAPDPDRPVLVTRRGPAPTRMPAPEPARAPAPVRASEPGRAPPRAWAPAPAAPVGVARRRAAPPSRRQGLPEPTPVGYLYALGAGGVACVGLLLYPVAPVWLGLLLIAFAAMLWRWPFLWLATVPALLPILDLTPWSGRVVLSAFDLFMLVGLAVVGLRLSGVRPAPLPGIWFAVGFVLLWLSWLVSTVNGLSPMAGGGQPVASSHPTLAAWHEGKGVLWALLAVPLLRRFRRQLGSTASAQLVFPGAVVGLILVCLNVLYERLVHVGAFDMDDVFRVTGPFASMHDGGAYIEAYLAFALPMLLVWMVLARRLWMQVFGAALVLVAGYAMLVTFSRGGYGGFAVGAAVVLLGLLFGARHLSKIRLWALAGTLAVVGVAAVPALTTGFAAERLARVAADLDSRLAHWRHALALMDDGLGSALLGEGFGRYPSLYLTSPRTGQLPGTFEVREDGGDAYLRLGKGEPVYLDQRVRLRAATEYRLTTRVRGAEEGAGLSLPLCEKALLYSFTCVWSSVTPDSTGAWQTMSIRVQSAEVGRGGRWPHGPVKLSLYNAGPGHIDLDDLSLKGPDGRELIVNGDFQDGAERWLFVTDQDLAWHIHEQFVEMYFAQGALGLLALAVLLIAAVGVLAPAIRAGRPEAVAFAGALAGFLSVGLLGSTVDAPRTAMLLYLGLFCSVLLVRGADKRRRRRRVQDSVGDRDQDASPAADA